MKPTLRHHLQGLLFIPCRAFVFLAPGSPDSVIPSHPDHPTLSMQGPCTVALCIGLAPPLNGLSSEGPADQLTAQAGPFYMIQASFCQWLHHPSIVLSENGFCIARLKLWGNRCKDETEPPSSVPATDKTLAQY